MKVLVLDDNQQRLDIFKKLFDNDEIVCCETYEEFKEAAVEDEFDRVYLDHDLGGMFVDTFNANGEMTGYDAAIFLVDKEIQSQAEIICHSLNPAGADAMFNLLKENGYMVAVMPFTQVWTMLDKLSGRAG